MKPAVLLQELHAARSRVTGPYLDRMRALGILNAFADMAAGYVPIGISPCEPVGQGCYQPASSGPMNLVVPVIEDGELIDLVAFRSTAPDDWLTRNGEGWALGMEEGAGHYLDGVTPHIFANPLEWLQAECCGICILNWNSPEIYKLDVLRDVTVSDVATAKLLRRAMTLPQRVPEIHIAKVLQHAA